jgi:hypothetical protein
MSTDPQRGVPPRFAYAVPDIAATKEPTFVAMELSRRSIAAWQPLPRRIPAYLRITR